MPWALGSVSFFCPMFSLCTWPAIQSRLVPPSQQLCTEDWFQKRRLSRATVLLLHISCESWLSWNSSDLCRFRKLSFSSMGASSLGPEKGARKVFFFWVFATQIESNLYSNFWWPWVPEMCWERCLALQASQKSWDSLVGHNMEQIMSHKLTLLGQELGKGWLSGFPLCTSLWWES